MNKKLTFFWIWILFLVAGSLIVISNTNFDVVFQNKILFANFFQRILGLTVFFLLTFQILFVGKIKTSLHKLNGLFTYFLVFLHPASWVVWNFFLRGNINPYYPFIDVCGICKPAPYEYFINLGRLGFWSITFAVMAARLVTWINDKWLRTNWRKVHILNYLAFYLVSVHAFFVGSDVTSKLFIMLIVICHTLVLWTIVKRVKRLGLGLKTGQTT